MTDEHYYALHRMAERQSQSFARATLLSLAALHFHGLYYGAASDWNRLGLISAILALVGGYACWRVVVETRSAVVTRVVTIAAIASGATSLACFVMAVMAR